MVNIEEKTLSNAGKTILNMTKANYDVAVFMGRLDKRMGDVHYLNKHKKSSLQSLLSEKSNKKARKINF